MHIARVLLGVLVGIAVVVGGAYLYVEHDASQRGGQVLDRLHASAQKEHDKRAAAQAAFDKFLADVDAAEKIDDSEQRCLAYPDIPGTQWDPALMKEICRTANLQIVHLDALDQLLRDNAAAKIDQIYDDYAKQDATDPKMHGILMRAFENRFEIENALAASVVERWVKAAPKSANALTARGAYRVSHAYAMRGTARSGDTPDASFAAMHKLMRDGVADLDAALAINPRQKVAWRMRIEAAMASGNMQTIDESARRALEIDPLDERVYSAWLWAVDPRWGGSAAAMQHVVDAAQPYLDRNPMLKMLAVGAKWREARGCCSDNEPATKPPYVEFAKSAPDYALIFDAAESGNSNDAVYFASEAIRIWPGPYTYLLRASILRSRRIMHPDVARIDADRNRALRSARSPETSDEDAARVKAAMGDMNSAIAAYRAALKANPRDVHAIDALIAIDTWQTKNFEEAAQLADKLTEYQPNVRDNWLTAAGAYTTDDAKFCNAIKRYGELGGVPRYVEGATQRCGEDVDKWQRGP